MKPNLKELISADRINDRVRELGEQISRDFFGSVTEERPLILLGILKGSFMFLADLARVISIPLEIEFAALSSYGNRLESSGTVELQLSPPTDLKNRCILVVEDIADTGRSLSALLDHLKKQDAADVRLCALLDKPDARIVEVPLDYIGFTVPKKYLVGYGLDAAQHYRQLPGIFELET